MNSVLLNKSQHLRLATAFITVVFMLGYGTAASSAQTFESGDVVYSEGENVRSAPDFGSETLTFAPEGAKATVLESRDEYSRVQFDELENESITGWVFNESLATPSDFAETKKRLDRIERRGYTIELLEAGIRSNSADGVSFAIKLGNISEDKTIKYASVTAQLFNPVSDPVGSTIDGESKKSVRVVGPVEPGERDSYVWENVWYTPVGECVEIHRIEVEHMDGSTHTYVNDLKDISFNSDSVNLRDEC